MLPETHSRSRSGGPIQGENLANLPDDQSLNPEVAPDGGTGKLTVAAVARRLGIAPGTLRTWDRRYGIGPTGHCSGEHRKYSRNDLARLVYMHKMVVSGVTPGEAARLAINYQAEHSEPDSQTLDVITHLDRDQVQVVKSLYKAASHLDRNSVETQIRDLLHRFGLTFTWMNALVPLLCAIGDDWEQTGQGIASEHMVSNVIKKIFSEVTVGDNPVNEVPVLLACLGEEMHSLALTALAAALADKGIQVQFLGARTPAEAIYEVVKRSAPPAIFLWAQLPENARLDIVTQLPVVRPTPRIILGGPGWGEIDQPGLILTHDLVEACNEISAALGL